MNKSLENCAEVGDYLREQRQGHKISLRQMARRIGISCVFLSGVERGRKLASETVLRGYAAQLGLSIDEVLLTAGRVPDDVLQILKRRPEMLAYLRELEG